MKRTYLLAVIALLLGVQIAFAQNVKRPDSYNYTRVQIAFAQNVKRPDSYNYTRGVEAVQSNNFEEALEYLNKELEENPDNGYALVWIAYVRSYQEEYIPGICLSDPCGDISSAWSIRFGDKGLQLFA